MRNTQDIEHIFRAYDIRGIYGDDLTQETMLNIGKGLGTFMMRHNMKRCLVGGDIRITTPTMASALIAGVSSAGVDVTSVGIASFGVALFGGWKKKFDVIAYITASHLTPEWNGLKMYYEEGQGFPEEDIVEIKEIVMSGEYTGTSWEDAGTVESLEFTQEYVDYLRNSFTMGRTLKAVVDCGNGANSLTAREVFQAVGIDAEYIFSEPDGRFPNRPSEPTPEALTVLIEKIRETEADFGVAFDGDGDRGVIVDDTGRVLSPDEVGIIFGLDLLKQKKGLILANVESSMAIEKILIPAGAEVKRIKVGHTFLTLEAKEHGAMLGIERSGHMIIPEIYLFDDAMIIPLRLAEYLSNQKRKLSDIIDEIPGFPKHSTNFDCPDKVKFDVISGLQKKFAYEYEEKVNTLDGVRVDLDNGWGLIRASNTSPVVRITVEAATPEDLDQLVDFFNGEYLSMLEQITN
jgi:phosphomannomutase / phosphoglucomutase